MSITDPEVPVGKDSGNIVPEGGKVPAPGETDAEGTRLDAEEFWTTDTGAEGSATATPPDTQVYEVPPPTPGLGVAYYWGGQSGYTRVTQVTPNFSRISYVRLPAGHYVVIASLVVRMINQRAPTETDPYVPSAAICTLVGPEGERDRAFVVAAAGTYLESNHEVTLKGAYSLNAEGAITLECALTQADAFVQARRTSVIAIQVGDVTRELSLG